METDRMSSSSAICITTGNNVAPSTPVLMVVDNDKIAVCSFFRAKASFCLSFMHIYAREKLAVEFQPPKSDCRIGLSTYSPV